MEAPNLTSEVRCFFVEYREAFAQEALSEYAKWEGWNLYDEIRGINQKN